LRELECADAEQVRAAVERARGAQSAWNALGVERRRIRLVRVQSEALSAFRN